MQNEYTLSNCNIFICKSIIDAMNGPHYADTRRRWQLTWLTFNCVCIIVLNRFDYENFNKTSFITVYIQFNL